MPEVPGQATPQPSPGAAAPQGQAQGGPPFGSSPATQPTQNAGHKMAGIKLLGLGLMAFENAVPMLGSNTEEGQATIKAIQSVGKYVPPGAVTPQDVMNSLKALQTKQQQGMQQMQQMRQAQAARAQQPGAGGMPAAA